VKTTYVTFPLVLVAALFPACKDEKKPDPAPTAPAKTASAAPAATSAPAKPSAAPAAASTAPAAAASGGADEGIGAPKYTVCAPQGANAKQLSPAFLDKMPACKAPDSSLVDKVADMGGNGKIIEGKGDCQFDKGISCHFHTSMEFVTSAKLKDDAVGELHCIVPSTDANSPNVYGAHLKCKAGTSPDKGKTACSKDLLKVLEASHCKTGWKCCDNGTLTKPVGKQSDGEKKLRPDFRICQDEAVEIDCGLLHDMHGHTANVAGLGEEYNGKFNAGHGDDHDDHHDDHHLETGYRLQATGYSQGVRGLAARSR
jgi:putative hemolysin